VHTSLEQRRLRWLASQFARPSGWAGRWLIGAWLDRIGRAMNLLAFEQLDLVPADRVLEVGFGGGELLRFLLDATSAPVIGVDVSKAMVRRARRRFRREIGSGRLQVLEGSIDRLPLPDASIDKACSVNNLYFWSDPAAAMAEFARVIRPGGRLVICFEPPEELRKWPGHSFGFRLYDADAVSKLAAGAGFGNIRIASGTGRNPDHFLCLSAERCRGNG
jgi:arsenite methyltransferase